MITRKTASIKVMLRTNRTNDNGEHPIIVRITKDRKSSIISVGFWVSPKQWDNSEKQVVGKHTDSVEINQAICKPPVKCMLKAV